MPRILVGTTSWTEKTLVESGRFYPPDVHSAEARLRYYATQFPVVEVDSSCYGLSSERNASLLVERTPDGFVFDVKAFRLFTQRQTPPEALPRDIRAGLSATQKKNLYHKGLPPELLDALWGRFRSALDPLRQSGKLGVVLFQFAPWFVFRPSSLDLIAACAEQLPGDRIAVKFRNKSWFADKHLTQTLEFEKAHGLVHVVVDEPPGFPSRIPAVWGATSFRSRHPFFMEAFSNHRFWYIIAPPLTQKKGISAAKRFNYLYSDQELQEFEGPVDELGRRTGELHVLFNTAFATTRKGMRFNCAHCWKIETGATAQDQPSLHTN